MGVQLLQSFLRVQQDQVLQLVIIKPLDSVLTEQLVQDFAKRPGDGTGRPHDHRHNWAAVFSNSELFGSSAKSLWNNLTKEEDSSDGDEDSGDFSDHLVQEDGQGFHRHCVAKQKSDKHPMMFIDDREDSLGLLLHLRVSTGADLQTQSVDGCQTHCQTGHQAGYQHEED